MAIETKLAIFKEKYSLPDEAICELKTIFDAMIIDFTHKIINNEPIKTIPKLDTTRVMYTEKKFATKIADEYASECNVTLEEIPSETGKVTKKDVEKYVKSKTGVKSKKSKISPDEPKAISKYGSKITSKTDIETGVESDTETKKIVSKKDKSNAVTKEKCNGITKDGNPCNLNATKTPDGSKKCYCFRHAVDWKQYEVSSDSDYDQEDSKEDTKADKLIEKDLDIVDSD